jgi:hypothetical protein
MRRIQLVQSTAAPSDYAMALTSGMGAIVGRKTDIR